MISVREDLFNSRQDNMKDIKWEVVKGGSKVWKKRILKGDNLKLTMFTTQSDAISSSAMLKHLTGLTTYFRFKLQAVG